MKGFVPVTKQSLLEMIATCRKIVANDAAAEEAKKIDHFVSYEKERMVTRRWYRLWRLPAARFCFDTESIKAYADTVEYPMFEGNPFKSLESDVKNSLAWIARIERIAESEFAGEPIQIDVDTFSRLSNPTNYFWARCDGFCYSVRSH